MKQLTFIGMFALATALSSAPALADNNNGRHSGWNSVVAMPSSTAGRMIGTNRRVAQKCSGTMRIL